MVIYTAVLDFGFRWKKKIFTIGVVIAFLLALYIITSERVTLAYRTAFNSANVAHMQEARLPMELQQYIQFRETNKNLYSFAKFGRDKNKRAKPNISNFTFTVTPLVRMMTPTAIVLRMRETHNGVRTKGGGCIYGEVDGGLWRRVCSFRDSFDGDYVIWCPRKASGCTEVTVQVQCVNFGAYSSLSGAIHHTIWRKTMCADKRPTRTEWSTRDAPLLATLQREAMVNNVVTWRRKTLHDLWYPSELLAPHTDSLGEQLCRCVKRFDKVVLMGASHMRYKFDFFWESCLSGTNHMPRKHGSISVGNVIYEDRPFVESFESMLNVAIGNATLTRYSLVIIQSGSHDLVYRGLPPTMETAVDRFVDILRQLKEMSDRVGFKLILQMMPPSPDVAIGTQGGRNNFAIAAFVQLLMFRLENLNIDIFDEFHTLLPVQYDHVCGPHYICRSDRIKPIRVTGHSGKMVLFLQMSKICNKLNK